MTDLIGQMIALLRRNGRATYVEIAHELGTSRDCVASRINPLLKAGKLRIVAAVAPQILGLTTCAHLAIKAEGDLQRISSALERSAGAVLIAITTGAFQIVVELQARNLTELRNYVDDVRSVIGVREIHVHLYERVLNSFFFGPEPDPSIQLDELDLKIVDHLLRDGRANFADIAKGVGLSPSGSRSRVRRLLSDGVVQIGAVKQRAEMTNELVLGFGISARGDCREAIEIFGSSPGLEFMARSIGRFDLLAIVEFGSLHECSLLTSRLRSLPSVDYCEQWLYVKVVRAQYFPAVTPIPARTGAAQTGQPSNCRVEG
jgi:DNA-binding Lrp family transcriptional regulator